MAYEGVVRPSCPDTGLDVPECSCARCLEAMLREIRPTLLDSEIKVTRLRQSGAGPHGDERRKAA